MAFSLKYGLGVIVIAVAVIYQVFVKDLLFVTMGIGRVVQPISDFPYRCRRIVEPKLQACEDMWLSEKTRELFFTCSDPIYRKTWMPNVRRLNESARSPKDVVISMDIDRPMAGGSFKHRVLETLNMAPGDERLHLVGFTGVSDGANTLLYLVNNRPSIDPTTGKLLDNSKVGANSTIEIFETAPRSSSIVHLRTIAHPQISTPNRIALTGRHPHEFYFTNDHGPHKAGLPHTLSPHLHTGDVSLCTTPSPSHSPLSVSCAPVSSSHSFPNGLAIHPKNSLLFVPSAWKGGIKVYSPQPDGSLQFLEKIPIPYPIDNLSVDSRGDVYAAALTRASELLGAFEDPVGGRASTTTVFRIRRKEGGEGGGFEVEKVLEEREREVLPGATTVVHDGETGRLFLSGVLAGWVTVCDPV